MIMRPSYRYFTLKEHADLFVSGNIRFLRTKIYRSLLDPNRQDEGELLYRTMFNHIETSKEIGNSVYSLSTSLILSEELKERFGHFVVRINDVFNFGECLNASVLQSGMSIFKKVLSSDINYYSSESTPNLDFEQRLFAKLDWFACEREYRYIFIPKNDLIDDEILLKVRIPPKLLECI
jgi:hypothetical protein